MYIKHFKAQRKYYLSFLKHTFLTSSNPDLSFLFRSFAWTWSYLIHSPARTLMNIHQDSLKTSCPGFSTLLTQVSPHSASDEPQLSVFFTLPCWKEPAWLQSAAITSKGRLLSAISPQSWWTALPVALLHSDSISCFTARNASYSEVNVPQGELPQISFCPFPNLLFPLQG